MRGWLSTGIAVGLVCSATASDDSFVQPGVGEFGRYVAGELIIGFERVPDQAMVDAVEVAIGDAVGWREIPHAPHPVNDPGGTHPLAMVRVVTLELDPELAGALVADLPGVRYAHPNWITQAAYEPNDPRWSEQCGPQAIDAQSAWDITTGSSEIIIAVADGGLNFDHEDFQLNVYVNADEIPGNGIDDDENGYIDDIHGRDCLFDDNTMDDGNGHGTHVAGTAAAAIDNGLGMAGMSDSTVMVLQVFNDNNGGSWESITEAIYYAVDNGADLLNYSGGGGGGNGFLADAVRYAWDNGMPVIAAAGNNNSTTRYYPAAYDTVIGVSGTDCDDQRYERSNMGDWLDVAAPAVNVMSSWVGGPSEYNNNSGTSMSSPHVSGLVALMLTLNRDLSPGQIRGILRDNAVDLGAPGYDEEFGYGRVDAYASLLAVPGVCPADIDGDGDADADDFFAYLDAFDAGDAGVCDVDGDGDCDAEDFFAYLDLFAGTC